MVGSSSKEQNLTDTG